jgi:hypothetical protein
VNSKKAWALKSITSPTWKAVPPSGEKDAMSQAILENGNSPSAASGSVGELSHPRRRRPERTVHFLLMGGTRFAFEYRWTFGE